MGIKNFLKKAMWSTALAGAFIGAGCDSTKDKNPAYNYNPPTNPPASTNHAPSIWPSPAPDIQVNEDASAHAYFSAWDSDGDEITFEQTRGKGKLSKNYLSETLYDFNYTTDMDDDNLDSTDQVEFLAKDSKGAETRVSFNVITKDTVKPRKTDLEGKMLFTEIANNQDTELWLVDLHDYSTTKVATNVCSWEGPKFSPDGTKIALKTADNNANIIDLGGNILDSFVLPTLDGGCWGESTLNWSNSGDLIFSGWNKPSGNIAGSSVNRYKTATKQLETLISTSSYVLFNNASLSPDEANLAFVGHAYGTNYYVNVMNMATRTTKNLASGTCNFNGDLRLSWLDNNRLAYFNVNDGKIYSVDLASTGAQVSEPLDWFAHMNVSKNRNSLILINPGVSQIDSSEIPSSSLNLKQIISGGDEPLVQNAEGTLFILPPNFYSKPGAFFSLYDNHGSQYKFITKQELPSHAGNVYFMDWNK